MFYDSKIFISFDTKSLHKKVAAPTPGGHFFSNYFRIYALFSSWSLVRSFHWRVASRSVTLSAMRRR